MRWPVKLLLGLLLAGIAAWVAIKSTATRFSTSPPDAAPGKPLLGDLLVRASMDPSRNNRGREFLKRVFARAREGATSRAGTNSPGVIQIAQVLEAPLAEVTKAKQLLMLAPALSEDEQMEAAEHAANLVTEVNYEALRSTLTDARTPGPVLDALLADLLNRGNSLKLPTLVAIARQQEHPRATEAHDLLELHLGEDHGTNWNAWLGAAKTHIAEHGE